MSEQTLREALENLRRKHRVCEDPWYSCPLSDDGCADDREIECNCGAEAHNAIIDAALSTPVAQPVAWLYRRKSGFDVGRIVARTPEELGGNIDAHSESWERIAPLYTEPKDKP